MSRGGTATDVLYDLHELNRALLAPATHLARAGAQMFSEPGGWLARLPGADGIAASYELWYRLGKHYDKPAFGIDKVHVRGAELPVIEETALARPFCHLRRFRRISDQPEIVAALKRDPVVLVVAPLSGHHATLLRDTVRTLLSGHDVYITDWVDARLVPLAQGAFDLGAYVGYLREAIDHIGAGRLHIVSVCQATVPALAAVALMAAGAEEQPRSLVMMGGPIDARRNPTRVNELATTKPLAWFESNLLHHVPARYPGRGRRVYPGFLQHAGFMAMNPMRHVRSHLKFHRDVARRDLGDAQEHRRFYDEFNAVLDMTAEYYLDCIRVVFQRHLLPRGLWHVGGAVVAPEAVTDTALMTIEGELDDISGVGQTQAALDLCAGVPAPRKRHLAVEGAGHYGIFSGRRWRDLVYPQLAAFIGAADRAAPPARRPTR